LKKPRFRIPDLIKFINKPWGIAVLSFNDKGPEGEKVFYYFQYNLSLILKRCKFRTKCFKKSRCYNGEAKNQRYTLAR